MEIAGNGRAEIEHSDQLVLVVERRYHNIAYALGENLLFNLGAVGIGTEVFDNEKFALNEGFIEDGVGELVDAILRRICTNSTICHVGPVVEHHDMFTLNGGEGQE